MHCACVKKSARNEKMTLLDGYIGIDTLTEQIRKKALKQGFEFNVMVVGKFV